MSVGLQWVCSLSLLLDSISDLSPVLHPCHKLKYFKNARWSEKRCRAAYVVTWDTYEMYYKTSCVLSSWYYQMMCAIPIFCVSIHMAYLSFQQQVKLSSKNMFDELPALAAPRSSDLCDELQHYLNSNPEHIVDVLMWWFERQHTYPSLSCMAMDYLMIPGV